MPKHPGNAGESDAGIPPELQDLISGMNLAELTADTEQVLSHASDRALSTAPTGSATASRRRPRRGDEVTLRVRVDIAHASPPIWRRLELSSSLFLDEVHQVLQVAFGWSDSHLHRFALGSSVWDGASEKFLCAFDVAEGEDEGVPASEVRLDEVLTEVHDELLYVYDYGDDWELRIRLESVVDRGLDDEPALCTGGRRAAPPEDCGGIYAYDERESEPDLADPFEADAVNDALR